MDVTYINPFISATIDTFKTMLSLDISADKPQLKKTDQASYDVSGIIGLSGNAVGTIVLSFPKPVALKLVSSLIGQTIKVVGAEVTDGIGEMVNIIAGYAKKDLTGYQLSISLPSVIIGQNHIINTMSGVPVLMVPFATPIGEFAMEVSLKEV
jgi:chemotaxis protein CheX